MSDISMCRNINCPLKETCYRFKAKPNDLWQSYCDFEPIIDPVSKIPKCEHYWKMDSPEPSK